MNKHVRFISGVGLAVALSACDREPVIPMEPIGVETGTRQPVQEDVLGANQVAPVTAQRREAEVEFRTSAGVKLEGDAEFIETNEGLRVELEVSDAPRGAKSILVHESGDCSLIGTGKDSESPRAPRIVGVQEATDLGNLGSLLVDADGDGKFEVLVPKANLIPGDQRSFLGKALVLVEAHDPKTDPKAKHAMGEAIACGVIQPES